VVVRGCLGHLVERAEMRAEVPRQVTLVRFACAFAELRRHLRQPAGSEFDQRDVRAGSDEMLVAPTRNNFREDLCCFLLSLSKMSSASGFEDRLSLIGEADVVDSGSGVGPDAGTRRLSSH